MDFIDLYGRKRGVARHPTPPGDSPRWQYLNALRTVRHPSSQSVLAVHDDKWTDVYRARHRLREGDPDALSFSACLADVRLLFATNGNGLVVYDDLRARMMLGVHREYASWADNEMVDVATHAKIDAVQDMPSASGQRVELRTYL